MSIDFEEKNGVRCLSIRGDMTVYTAAEQKNQLFQRLQIDPPCRVDIDLSEVSEIDCAGLQILLLLKAESSKRHIELHFIHHSKAVVEVLELLNLTAFFGDPVVIPAGWNAHE